MGIFFKNLATLCTIEDFEKCTPLPIPFVSLPILRYNLILQSVYPWTTSVTPYYYYSLPFAAWREVLVIVDIYLFSINLAKMLPHLISWVFMGYCNAGKDCLSQKCRLSNFPISCLSLLRGKNVPAPSFNFFSVTINLLESKTNYSSALYSMWPIKFTATSEQWDRRQTCI